MDKTLAVLYIIAGFSALWLGVHMMPQPELTSDIQTDSFTIVVGEMPNKTMGFFDQPTDTIYINEQYDQHLTTCNHEAYHNVFPTGPVWHTFIYLIEIIPHPDCIDAFQKQGTLFSIRVDVNI